MCHKKCFSIELGERKHILEESKKNIQRSFAFLNEYMSKGVKCVVILDQNYVHN